MTSILSLDLSKRSTGWAIWQSGWSAPRFGSVQLGSEYTSDGGCYVKLHHVLRDLRVAVSRFESIYYEEPINAAALTGHTNADTLRVLSGLAAHTCSFGHAMGLRVQAVNIASWRRHFVGKMPLGTKTKDWKAYADERCRQYGWKPQNSDEADALGILDYAVSLEGVRAPWSENETLRAPLEVAR